MRSLLRLAVVALLAPACGSGGSSPADLAVPSFVASDCGMCVETHCAQPIQTCSTDPGCAAWYSCVRGCPVSSSGDADSTCEAACPAPSSSSGTAAQKGVNDCRTLGAGTQCAACGHPPADLAATNPLLNQMCAMSTETNACYICEDQKCCDSEAACHNDADCGALRACLKACDNADGGDVYACRYSCQMKAPTKALVEFYSLLACIEILCIPDCGALDPCTACTVTKCQDAYIACQTDSNCQLISDCFVVCANGDIACKTACENSYPAGKTLFESFGTCAANACMTEC
jgi:hypothetical protein